MSKSNIMGYSLGLIFTLAIAMFAFLAIAHPVGAQEFAPITASDLLEVEEGTTIGEVAGLGEANLQTVVGQIIRAILGFLGVVAVCIILWGGFKWMTSGGQDEKVRDARKLIVMGIVGLAIVLSAYAIASFVITSLVGAVTSS